MSPPAQGRWATSPRWASDPKPARGATVPPPAFAKSLPWRADSGRLALCLVVEPADSRSKKENGTDMSKIYLVDDDRDIVEAISMVLETEGFEVKAQNDDEDVAKRVAEYGADLVILDVMFPEDESAGFRMARELRHSGETKDIPILMLSAINEKGHYAGTFSNRDRDDTFLPVDAFVEKPIQPASLVAQVKDLLK